MRLAKSISFLLLSAICLSACATQSTGSTSENQASQKSLERVELAPGECGMFGWTADEKRSFVFYADRETSKFVPEDQIVELSAQAAFPSLAYLDPFSRPVTINLGAGEQIIGGLRYPSSSIRSETDEGWERIIPVSIVRACQPR